MANNAQLSKHQKRYEWFRHHAWAGLGLLSVFLAINFFIQGIPQLISIPIVFVLISYILVSLFYTYKYSFFLSIEGDKQIGPPDAIARKQNLSKSKEALKAEIEQAHLKLEKKRIKAEAKKLKKTSKNK
jgi:hypothetical protein